MTAIQTQTALSDLSSRGARNARPLKAGVAARASLVLAGLACAGGCASLAPMAVKWGADLVSAAADNYSQQYSRQLEGLLLAVFTEQAKRLTGKEASATAESAYPPSASQGQPYPTASPYPTQTDPYPTAGAPSASPYPPTPSSAAATPPAKSPIVLDVAILAQRASARAAQRTEPVPIRDGEVLRDGGSDPRKGDVVKFSFRASCNCYVYIIGVDATGYVVRVFPENEGGKPVRANQQYVVPQGTAWYGLDQHKGTEQVFFLASRKPRRDIETSLGQLAKTDRNSLAKNYRPVREAALPDPATRGLVKVQMGTKSTVSSETGQPYSFTPQAFAAPAGSDDVVVTRWFRHE
jgi:F0F1-type ATP synthase membrane subunit c/vacuolar-type H+-ATPase subunit K